MKSVTTFSALLLLCCFFQTISASPRNPAGSMAQQLGFGIKRAAYYLETLIEKCDNVDDIEQWILFMDSYVKCDAEAYPKKSAASFNAMDDEYSLTGLNEICAAWPQRRECSNKLALRLNACLGSQLENGEAGTNALGLADAHMKFICGHKNDYTKNLEEIEDIVPVERRSLTCFQAMKEPLENCITEVSVMSSRSTFCEKFGLAKECLMKTSMQFCKNPAANQFLHSMLDQLQFELQCSSTNEGKLPLGEVQVEVMA